MIESTQTVLPLVSIVVLTYNSECTVQETLDSLTRQDYSSLEVLVCDDGSTDSTPLIVQAWLDSHAHLFTRAVLLPSSVNEGICKNINKGYSAARGDWLKPIAGDDLLEPHAIRTFVAIAVNSNHDVIVSLLKTFGDAPYSDSILPKSNDLALIAGPSAQLREELMRRNPVPAPGVFLNRLAYVSVGGIDLSFRHLDDWPLWVKFVESDKRFGVVHESLVRYRVSTASISACRLATSVNKDFLQDLAIFYIKYQRQFLSPARRWDRLIELFRWKLARGVLRPYPNLYKVTRLLHALSPVSWINLFWRSG